MTLELTLTSLAHSGDALGRLPDGRACFVPFALPGERVRVRIAEESKRFVRAQLLEVLDPAPQRVAARCPHFGVCGGCQLQHMPYEMQLEAKAEALRSHLTRTGKLEHPPIRPIIPSPAPWNYRNFVQFQVAPDGKLGFYRVDGDGVLPVTACDLLAPEIAALWPQLDMEPIPGLMRVGLRVGAGDDLLLTLESDDPDPPAFAVDLPLSAVHLSAEGLKVLSGSDYTVIEVLGRFFQVSAGAFFQVNIPVTEAMVAHVLEHIPEALNEALDLYCGGGLFSAFLAPRAQRLVGVEASPLAAGDFVTNLDEFENVELYEAPVAEALPHLDVSPDLVLVDPPRSGLGRRVVSHLATLAAPRLVYVSCNPATLARDARQLAEAGYRLSHITPFDMFPQTYHVESISFWEK